MGDNVGPARREEFVPNLCVSHIPLQELDAPVKLCWTHGSFVNLWVQVIDSNHLLERVCECLRDGRADESCTSGDNANTAFCSHRRSLVHSSHSSSNCVAEDTPARWSSLSRIPITQAPVLHPLVGLVSTPSPYVSAIPWAAPPPATRAGHMRLVS